MPKKTENKISKTISKQASARSSLLLVDCALLSLYDLFFKKLSFGGAALESAIRFIGNNAHAYVVLFGSNANTNVQDKTVFSRAHIYPNICNF